MNDTLLILIRHGETLWNTQLRMQEALIVILLQKESHK